MKTESNTVTESVQVGQEPIVRDGYVYIRGHYNNYGEVLVVTRASNSDVAKLNLVTDGCANTICSAYIVKITAPCLQATLNCCAKPLMDMCSNSWGDNYIEIDTAIKGWFSGNVPFDRVDEFNPIYGDFTSTIQVSIPDKIAFDTTYDVLVIGSNEGTKVLSGPDSLGISGMTITPKDVGTYSLTATLNKYGNYPKVSVSIQVDVISKQYLSLSVRDLIVGSLVDLGIESRDRDGNLTGLDSFTISSNQEGISFVSGKAIATRQGIFDITIFQSGNDDFVEAELYTTLIVGIDNFNPVLIASGGYDVEFYYFSICCLSKLLRLCALRAYFV